jgi:hypothetical protein
MEQTYQSHQGTQSQQGSHHQGEPHKHTPSPAPKKKTAAEAKKRNYKRDGILFKDFTDEEIDTLEEIASIQDKTVEDILLEVLKPQVTAIVENFQKAKQELLIKAAAGSFKGIIK